MGPLPKVGGKTSSSNKGKSTNQTNQTTKATTKLPTINTPVKTGEEIAADEEAKKLELLQKQAEEEAIKRAEEEARKRAEEEARKQEEEARKQAEEEERKKRETGDVTLIYEQYNEKFPILSGMTTAESIDEVYCLSFVMPNCKIHLSVFSPQDKRKLEELGNIDIFVKEDPSGTYKGLAADFTYYVYVEQEAEQLARDQERMRRIAEGMDGAKKVDDGLIKPDDGRGTESCSCLYGNPCVDEYGIWSTTTINIIVTIITINTIIITNIIITTIIRLSRLGKSLCCSHE